MQIDGTLLDLDALLMSELSYKLDMTFIYPVCFFYSITLLQVCPFFLVRK